MIECPPLTDDVIKAINEEINYANKIKRADSRDHSVAGQVLTLCEYAEEARREWVRTAGNEQALHALRKCAQISIRALLLYGCPRRLDYSKSTAQTPHLLAANPSEAWIPGAVKGDK